MTTAHTEVFPNMREVTKFINENHLKKEDIFPPIEDKGQWFLIYFTNL